MIWHRSNPFWRSVAWTGAVRCSPLTRSTMLVEMIVSKGDEISLRYSVPDASLGMHARLSYTGRYEFRI